MIAVLAAHIDCFDGTALSAHARTLHRGTLRRPGALAELCLAGAHACLGDAPEQASALLWGSGAGIREASARVIDDLCILKEPPLPFDFLATQPTLAAVPLRQRLPGLRCVLYQPWGQDALASWSRMLHLARLWLKAGRYQRVLCGQLEPGANEQRGSWLLLGRAEGAIAGLGCLSVEAPVGCNLLAIPGGADPVIAIRQLLVPDDEANGAPPHPPALILPAADRLPPLHVWRPALTARAECR